MSSPVKNCKNVYKSLDNAAGNIYYLSTEFALCTIKLGSHFEACDSLAACFNVHDHEENIIYSRTVYDRVFPSGGDWGDLPP